MARNPHLDVAKGILITLVVVGHALESGAGGKAPLPGWSVSPQEWILSALYIVHMPAFAFTVGLTAKLSSLAQRIVMPLTLFAVFQTLYAGPFIVTGGQAWWAPGYALWFLLAMALWHLALPIATRFPMTALTGAIVLGVGAGIAPIDGSVFAWVRSLTTMPFFVAGFIMGIDRLPAARSTASAVRSLILLFAVMGATAATVPSIWVRGAYTYAYAHAGIIEGMAWRAVCLVLSAVGTWAFLRSVTWVQSEWVRRAGNTSLAIYILHIPFMITLAIAMRRVGVINPWITVVTSVLVGLILAWLLALPPFTKVDKGLRAIGLLPLRPFRHQ